MITEDPSTLDIMRNVTGWAELMEVERHRERLSSEHGVEVGLSTAMDDWLRRHASRWRQHYRALGTRLQVEEMMKHKWIESEKARRDLGSAAVIDWVDRYAGPWREWYDREYHRLVALYPPEGN